MIGNESLNLITKKLSNSTATGSTLGFLLNATHIYYSGMFRNLSSRAYRFPDGSHVHLGPKGTNGPIVYELQVTNAPQGFIGPDFLNLLAFPSLNMLNLFRTKGLYVNVHTPRYPFGEIRGQIVPLP
mmetsp:Transcript_19857/g.32574  ORF Transcript_19857/g.32574 Transcript_19857/m.32574 type:complete len:127 (-) Transcript_19857:296-676(-)